MSQRQGMADGRGYTIQNSSKLLDTFLMSQQGLNPEDNRSYRQYLQTTGPTALSDADKLQPTLKKSFDQEKRA